MAREQRDRQPLNPAFIWMRENVITTVLAVFIVLSLLLHVLTLGALFRVREITARQLDLSSTRLAEVRQQKIRYDFPVDQTFPISTTFPISETVSVPIRINVPISRTITVPIDTVAGTFNFDVPLNFTVPVSDTVDVPIRKQIPFRMDIPIKTQFPVDIDLSEPPLGDVLKQFEDALRKLRASL